MHKKCLLAVLLVGFAAAGTMWYVNKKTACACEPCECVLTKKTIALNKAMRKLWEDHITYTRNFIISALGNLGDKDAVTHRLLKNQDDLGNAIKPFYGHAAGDALAKLLREHILIAADIVQDAVAGNTKKLDQDKARWKANADEIATFLSNANPNWSHKELQDMLYKHLELTEGELVSRLKKEWVADVGFYDKGHEHMLMFADVLTNGIAQQFPDKI